MSSITSVVNLAFHEGVEVPAPWRAARITSAAEVLQWVRAGVFDGYSAGLLKAAGIMPSDLDELMHRNVPLGFSFAVGNIGLDEVVALVKTSDLTRAG